MMKSWTLTALRIALRTPGPPPVLEVADQFLLLGVHRNDRLALSLGPSDLVVEIVKLGVPIRVLGAFFRLAIRLQRVAELVQQSVDEARTHRMAQGLQLDRQLADALRRPSQGAVVRRPGGDRFEQGIEVRQQRHVGVDAPLAAAARPTHTAGVQRGVRPQFLQAASDPGPRHPRGPGHLGNAAMPQRLRLGGGPQAPRALVQHRRQSFVLRSQSLFGIHTSRITPFRQTCSTYFDPLPYVLVAIVKKQLHVDRRLAEILQIFTVSLFEKVDILQLLTRVNAQYQSEHRCNQLTLFHL